MNKRFWGWLTSVPSLVSDSEVTNEEQLLLENKVNSVQGKVFINDGTPGGTTKAYQNITTYPDGSMSILQKNLTTGEISLQKINPLGQRIFETSFTPHEANTLIGANSSSKMLVGNGAVSQSVISRVSYQTGNNSLVLYDKTPVPVATNRTLVPPLTTNRALATVPLLTNGIDKVGQVQSTLIPKANVNNMDLLKAFKRVENKKNYYYSKLTTTMEIEGVKFRFPSIEYALNERATEELQKNPLTMPTEMQEHIFGEIKHLRNGTIRATGGHAVSDQVKISDITNIQYNNVFQAKVEIYDPVTNQYILKSNNNGLSTFFPPYWTKDRILIEAESAFRNKVPHSNNLQFQNGYDEGKTRFGVDFFKFSKKVLEENLPRDPSGEDTAVDIEGDKVIMYDIYFDGDEPDELLEMKKEDLIYILDRWIKFLEKPITDENYEEIFEMEDPVVKVLKDGKYVII